MPVAEEKKLRIAFTFDSKAEWLALGYSEEECAEFNSDKEIDDVAGALRSLGYEVDMVGNIKSLAKRFASSGHNWDLVFNVCEGPNGYVGREAHVPGLLEAWGIDYTFSDCATLALCLDKCKTKVRITYHFRRIKWRALTYVQPDGFGLFQSANRSVCSCAE
jgi:D-alanine-D-alanine ligase